MAGKKAWNKLVLASIVCLLFMGVEVTGKKAWNKLVLASVVCLLFMGVEITGQTHYTG
jgi:hypothetical protein